MTRQSIAVFTLLAFVACGGGTGKEGTEGSGGTGTGTGTTDGPGPGPGGDSGGVGGGAAAWEPVAVGFELNGASYEDGTLGTYIAVGASGPVEILPNVTLTLASIDYFSGATDESCEIVTIFLPLGVAEPADESWDLTVPSSDDFPSKQMASYGASVGWEGGAESASAVPHVTWEGHLYVVDDGCTDAVVPVNEWTQAPGATGTTPSEAFDGMHFAVQVAPITDYLLAPYADATWFPEYESTTAAHYICIEYAEGMRCEDWTLGYHWSFNEDEKAAETDGSSYFIPQDITSVPGGSALPPAYINAAPFWYQDFPLMDFGSLRNGL